MYGGYAGIGAVVVYVTIPIPAPIFHANEADPLRQTPCTSLAFDLMFCVGIQKRGERISFPAYPSSTRGEFCKQV